MAKDKTGYVFQDKKSKAWYARVTFTDSTGQKRNVKRTAKSKSDAKELLKTITRQLDDEGEKAIQTAQLTFKDLANHYEKHYVKEAEYVNGKKVSGLRDVDRAKRLLVKFRAYFGNKKLRTITHGDIANYKRMRLQTPTVHKRQRSLSTMNRELVVLRRMMNIAVSEGWLIKNPFNSGEALIQPSDERMRERILTLDEEKRLLDACNHPLRQHLKPFLIALLDTGARKGEMFKLTWQDVCFASQTITIQAHTTKTLRERQVAMTQRLYDALWKLYENSEGNLSSKVFKFTCIRTAFKGACKAAKIPHGGIDGITLHSLRHTAATRLVQGQMPLQMVGRILGHTQPQTTYRYLTANEETIKQAASILDSLHAPIKTSNNTIEATKLIN